MLLHLAATLLALVLTLTVTAPAVRRAGAALQFRTPPPFEAYTSSDREVKRTFVPLDFGEDRLSWPSQVPWPSSGLPRAEWPSSGWTDDWRATTTEAPARKAKPEPARPAEPSPKKARAKANAPAPRPEPTPPAPALTEAAGDLDAWVSSYDADELTRDQAIELVNRLGLVGAVRHLMDSRGWTFQQAAQRISDAKNS